jgi:tetratricopeptide (TPR) repeat protein
LIGAPRPELYDIQSDPGETENIAREEPSAYREMRRSLGDQGADLALPSTAPVEDLEKLAALGYLGSIKAPPDSGTLPDPKDRIDDINKLREAFALESRGRSAEAIDVLRRLVERNPGFMDAWNKLALTLDTAGRWTEAIETYQRALAHAPSLTTEYALSLSSIHLKLGQLEEAISHAELAADRHPAKAAILLGRIAFVQGQLPLAEQHARVAMGSSNERFTAAVLLIKVLTAQRRLEEAMALAVRVRDEAVAGAGGPIQGLAFVYGDLLARRGDNHQAEEAFREEIRLFPRDRQTYANLALLLTTQGRIDQARALLEELGERNPGLQTYLFAA